MIEVKVIQGGVVAIEFDLDGLNRLLGLAGLQLSPFAGLPPDVPVQTMSRISVDLMQKAVNGESVGIMGHVLLTVGTFPEVPGVKKPEGDGKVVELFPNKPRQ